MKKILTIIVLIFIWTTLLSASSFFNLAYSNTETNTQMYDENGNEMLFPNTKYLKFRWGTHYFPLEEAPFPFDWYMDIGGGYSKVIKNRYNGEILEVRYQSYLLNGGITYGFNNYIVLFGGIGINHRRANIEVESSDNDPTAIVIENKFNANFGGILYLYKTSFGITGEYDTAIKTISLGLSYRF